MEQYKEIHLWDMPPETQIMIKKELRYDLITQYIKSHKTWADAAAHLNSTCQSYGQNVKYGKSIFGHWRSGLETTRNIQRNLPLRVAIAMSKILSNNNSQNNVLMEQIENNLEYCTTESKGIKLAIHFPIKLTPELVSIIFHLCGDGHLGIKGQVSHYRQVNPKGLENFSQKMHNCFGKFTSPYFEESKIVIPKVISSFFKAYFNLNSCYWDVARINDEIKKLSNEFLLAGLTSFIIDEGHIGDAIEIYSGNKRLLEDIREIIDKLGYIGYGPKIKREKNGKYYRVYISLKSAIQFYKDIQVLKQDFPTCGLAHKEHLLKEIVDRQTRTWKRRPYGVTQKEILKLLSFTDLNSLELKTKLQISASTLREHLAKLELQNIISKRKPEKSCCLVWSKIK